MKRFHIFISLCIEKFGTKFLPDDGSL